MAIVNIWSGFDTSSNTNTVTIDADSEFGQNVNLNINTFNIQSTSGIVNTYLDTNNQFGSATRFTSNEQRLIQNLITETIHHNGISVRYCPRWSPFTDRVWNERPESMFDKGTQMDMLITSATGFDGEGDVMTQYGIEFREEIIVSISMTRFEKLYGNLDSDLRVSKGASYAKMFERVRPLEGDLLVVPFGRSAQNKRQYAPKVFEILRVTTYQDGPFFQLGSNYQYKLRARLFELSFEDINFNPTVVEYNPDGTQLTYIDSDTGKIARSIKGIDVIDSETRRLNITKDSDLFSDSWASNVDIEKEAQIKDVMSLKDPTKVAKKVPSLVKDYSGSIWGGNIIDDLDDI